MHTLFSPRWTRLVGPSLFDAFAWPTLAATAAPRGPALNVWTTDEAVHVEAELPGVAESDLELSVVGDQLTLAGRRPDATAEGARVHRRERPSGEFRRVLTLPFEVDADAVRAELVDGVLTVTLPAAAALRPRVIPVQTVR